MSSRLEDELPEEFEYNSTKEYYYVSGSAQEIYFDGSKESVELIKNLLNLRPNLKKKIFLKLLPYWKYNPIKKTEKLPYAPSNNFPGNIIVKAGRRVSFDLENRIMVRISVEDPSSEKKFRQKLLDLDINVPRIIGLGDSYIEEELLETKRISSLYENILILEEAYSQLIRVYEASNPDKDSKGYYRAQIHGDFKLANIGVSKGGQVYLFDWEERGKGPIYYDILTFFWREFKCENMFYRNLIKELISNTAEVLDVPEEEIATNVLYALEELMGDKDSKKANEFSGKVKALYD